MTIDDVMLGAVRHYLRGNVAVAKVFHDTIKFRNHSLDTPTGEDSTYRIDLDVVKRIFMFNCKRMLGDPFPKQYSHQEGYELTSKDKEFLVELQKRAEEADWHNPAEVKGISEYIDEYAPHEGLDGLG
ncbi:MAG: hypothetical protein GY861_09170 [bacterium]|nr:hypothetical protein [bacterium]